MLILTEKPSVAAAFAVALGCRRKDGYFENDRCCVVYAVGHLLQQFEPEDYNPDFGKWNLSHLPIIPDRILYKVIDKTKSQLAVIKKCFTSHPNDQLILATDAEREGELIGAEILTYAGFTNYENAKRFWVSEALTKDVILSGIKSAKPLSYYASYKIQGYARQQADWLVGMNLTRFITLSCGSLLTIGRVQTAVLGAIYEREKQIANFVKEKYIEVIAGLTDQKINFSVKLLNNENKEFPHRFNGQNPFVKEVIRNCYPPSHGKIITLKKEKKTVPPPKLFNLTGLQKEAHKTFGYTPERTLEIAQNLYEKHKCLSYPRTPSTVMGDENVDLVKGIFNKLKPVYQNQARGANESAITNSNKHLFNSSELQDHHALIPLNVLPDGVSDDDAAVYGLVVTRFFTVLKAPYIYNAVSINVCIGEKAYMFAGNGIEVLQAGWKAGIQPDGDEDLPSFAGLKENGVYNVVSLNEVEKLTEPKKHFTYATLLALMENPRNEEGKLSGLGTPATRGSILKTLADRKYTALKGKNILITDKGNFLIDVIQKNEKLKQFISIPETTRWEEQLHTNTDVFLNGIKSFVKDVIKTTITETYQNAEYTFGKCPLCGNPVREGKKNYYCSGYKEGCAFVIWKEVSHAAVSASDAAILLAGKKTGLKKCQNKDGKQFQARFYLKDNRIAFEFENKKT